MRSMIKRLVRDENGSEVIDYVLVVGLVVVAALLLVGTLGGKIVIRWRNILDLL